MPGLRHAAGLRQCLGQTDPLGARAISGHVGTVAAGTAGLAAGHRARSNLCPVLQPRDTRRLQLAGARSAPRYQRAGYPADPVTVPGMQVESNDS